MTKTGNDARTGASGPAATTADAATAPGFALARGVLFGLGLAALPVAAQSYVAAITPAERDRVRGIARAGAAMGLALVLGPGVGGLLAAFGLLPALYVAPVVLLAVAIAVAVALPPNNTRPRRPDGPGG
jgi:DHA1 family tetracycline resistance protein-like MFS transporter